MITKAINLYRLRSFQVEGPVLLSLLLLLRERALPCFQVLASGQQILLSPMRKSNCFWGKLVCCYKEGRIYLLSSRQHLTSLCYEESYVGRVLLLLGIILESIEFYKKGLIRPRVFIKKVFSKVEFKFMRDTCVNLASAIFGIC